MSQHNVVRGRDNIVFCQAASQMLAQGAEAGWITINGRNRGLTRNRSHRTVHGFHVVPLRR